jgi:hypothetical protein
MVGYIILMLEWYIISFGFIVEKIENERFFILIKWHLE